MVKQITQFNTTHKIGSISIEVDELIDILEKRNFEKVTATTSDHEFESLADIKAHKSLLAGFPDLNADGINLIFSRFGPYLKLYRHNPDLLVKLQTVLKDLRAKRTFFDSILQHSYKVWMGFLALFWAMQIYLAYSPKSLPTYFQLALYIVNGGVVLFFFVVVYSAIRPPVRLKPKSAFGKYAGEIMIGLVVAIVSGVVLKKLFGV